MCKHPLFESFYTHISVKLTIFFVFSAVYSINFPFSESKIQNLYVDFFEFSHHNSKKARHNAPLHSFSHNQYAITASRFADSLKDLRYAYSSRLCILPADGSLTSIYMMYLLRSSCLQSFSQTGQPLPFSAGC